MNAKSHRLTETVARYPLCRQKPLKMFLSQTYNGKGYWQKINSSSPFQLTNAFPENISRQFHHPCPLWRKVSSVLLLIIASYDIVEISIHSWPGFCPHTRLLERSLPGVFLSLLTLSVFPAGLTSKPHHAQQKFFLRYVDRFGCDCHRLSATDLWCLFIIIDA